MNGPREVQGRQGDQAKGTRADSPRRVVAADVPSCHVEGAIVGSAAAAPGRSRHRGFLPRRRTGPEKQAGACQASRS